MSDPRPLAEARSDRRTRALLLVGLVAIFMAVTAAKASATIEIQNYNDPAGDPTVFTYQLFGADPTTPLASDVLGDGAKRSFGPDPNVYGTTYTLHAVLPAGWHTVDIQCDNNPGTATFVPDLANGSVTIQGHQVGEDQYCAFTNRKGSGSTGGGGGGGTGGGGTTGSGAGSGISPTLPGGSGSSSKSKAPRLLRVSGGTHYALFRVSIPGSSVIKAQLRKGTRVVGTKRVKHSKAGTYQITVKMHNKSVRRYRQSGLKHVTLTLRIVVVGSNKATKVYTPRVIVRI
jgi:hypothetical protein